MNSIKRPETIYKYGKASNILSSLKEHYLWSSIPEEFDDPYDTIITLDKTGWTSNISLQDQETEARRKNRIVSFSSKPDDPVLWYYYAEEYKGIVMGFKNTCNDNSASSCAIKLDESIFTSAVDNKLKQNFPLIKVDYSDVKPSAYNPQKDPDKVLHKQLKTKNKSWEFEDEYRILLPLSYLARYRRKIPFKKEALSSVLVGIETPLSTIDEIKDILQQEYGSKVDLYQIELSRTSYHFNLKKIPY